MHERNEALPGAIKPIKVQFLTARLRLQAGKRIKRHLFDISYLTVYEDFFLKIFKFFLSELIIQYLKLFSKIPLFCIDAMAWNLLGSNKATLEVVLG